MIDWNNNGKIDPEEIFLTEEILGEEDEEEEKSSQPQQKHRGCLFALLTLPILIILKGLRL